MSEIEGTHTAIWWLKAEVDVLWVDGVRSLVHRPTGVHVPSPVPKKDEFENYVSLWVVLRIHDRLTGDGSWRENDFENGWDLEYEWDFESRLLRRKC